ncbi:MAG: hypothetical protein IPG90_16275 [Bacteroidetes bacterium]|nr:hypothetical protein [Bacteroidota bacterium]
MTAIVRSFISESNHLVSCLNFSRDLRVLYIGWEYLLCPQDSQQAKPLEDGQVKEF